MRRRRIQSRSRWRWWRPFSVSSYVSTLIRTTKPFNPLLGETYELDRVDEMGLRLIVEQVSHHPPSAAFHAISTHNGGWELWGEMTVTSKFRGKYLSVTPLGIYRSSSTITVSITIGTVSPQQFIILSLA